STRPYDITGHGVAHAFGPLRRAAKSLTGLRRWPPPAGSGTLERRAVAAASEERDADRRPHALRLSRVHEAPAGARRATARGAGGRHLRGAVRPSDAPARDAEHREHGREAARPGAA